MGIARKMAALSVGAQSSFSVVSTTLEDKGLKHTPVAEKHISRRTGKPYWRFRRRDGKFVKRDIVAQLGFAWWPREDDPTRGVPKSIANGKTMKHDTARELLLQYRSDIANAEENDEDELSEEGEGLDMIQEGDDAQD